MEAIRKIQTGKNGHVEIQLPKEFWDKQVEIIVLPSPPATQQSKVKKVFEDAYISIQILH